MLGNIPKRRRRSTPNSPASPTAAWHNTNPSDALFTAATQDTVHRTVTRSESPFLDGDVITASLPLSSSVPGRSKDLRMGTYMAPRLSEESTTQQSRVVVEPTRPATSSSFVPRLEIPSTEKRRVYSSSPLEPSFSSPRPSSSQGPESPSPDVGTTRYGVPPAATNRNYGHPSLTTGSPIEDSVSSKLTGGKKSRLNYLNPMSILARRRSSQNQNYLDDVNLHVKTQSIPNLPDDYDPRIRGNIVHDFSIPRPRRIQSSLDSPTFQTASSPSLTPAPEYTRRASDFAGLKDAPPKRSSQSPKYSPAFKEHFQDDRHNLRPAQTGYLHSLTIPEQKGLDTSSGHVPAFAKNLPAHIDEIPEGPQAIQTQVPPPMLKEEDRRKRDSRNADTKTTSDQGVAVSKISQTNDMVPALSTTPRHVSGLPKHMTSTSSRFSFIGNGDSAAQERLLEERHKQHANNKRHISLDSYGAQDEEDYDDFDDDANEGFEERIPGVNADDSEDEGNRRISIPLHDTARIRRINLKIDANAANDFARTSSRQAFHFTPEPSALSSISTGNNSQPTPRDEDGQIIGLANTTYSPYHPGGHHRQRSDLSIMEISGGLTGLGLTNAKTDAPLQKSSPLKPLDRFNAFKDEDIYFDDGEFDDLMDDVNNEAVDEEIFEDGNDAVRDIPAENAKKFELAYHGGSAVQGVLTTHDQSIPRLALNTLSQETLQPSQASTTTSGVLTEDNLAAYHAALVSAADLAAANGKFTRSVSNSYYSDTSTSQIEDSSPGLTDDIRNSKNVEFSAFEDNDGFDFDDQDEDDLIAEANAEALENDDDGFYGQEFGFYARAKGRDTSDREYGGYFSSRGSNGIKRSHSAKANFQEPSLTPITERSEWSARNSVASLQIPGMPGSAQSIPSPGIAQLLDFDSASFDENMSLEALMKLRRGAFGGSSSSVNSLGAGPAGSSPLAHVSAHSFGGDLKHRMTSSMHSLTGSVGIPEDEEEGDSEAGEGSTFTRIPSSKEAEVLEFQGPDSPSAFSPTFGRSEKRIGHRRNSSGGESVSYMKDSDGRWLLERRRTGEDGEGEVIGREYLAGSRI